MSVVVYNPADTWHICLSKYQFPERLNWGHKFWKGWIRESAKQQIMSKKPVSCPDWWTDLKDEIRDKILSQELLEKYEEFQRQNKVDRDPNLHWWPAIDWDRFVFWVPNPNDLKTKAIWECGFEFCIVCHNAWHS